MSFTWVLLVLVFVLWHANCAIHNPSSPPDAVRVNNLTNLTTYRSSTPTIHVHISHQCRATIQSDSDVVGIFQPQPPQPLQPQQHFSSWSWSDQRPGLHRLQIRAVCAHSQVHQYRFLYTIIQSSDREESEWGLPALSTAASTVTYRPNSLIGTTVNSKTNYCLVLHVPTKRLAGHPVSVAIHLMQVYTHTTNVLLRENIRVSLHIHCNEKKSVGTSSTSSTSSSSHIEIVSLRRGTGLVSINASHWTKPQCTIEGKLDQDDMQIKQTNQNSNAMVITTVNQKDHGKTRMNLPNTITEELRTPSDTMIYIHKQGLTVHVGIQHTVDLCGPTTVIVPSGVNLVVKSGELRIGFDCDSSTYFHPHHRPDQGSTASLVTSHMPGALWGGIEILTPHSTVKLHHVHIMSSGGSTSGMNNGHYTSEKNVHCTDIPILFDVRQGGTLFLNESFILGHDASHGTNTLPLPLRQRPPPPPPRGIVGDTVQLIHITNSILSSLSNGINVKNSKLIISQSTFMHFDMHGANNQDGIKSDALTVPRSEDHDGFYIVGGETIIDETTISGASDDCIDSGTGPGGSLKILNSFIEYCMHEGVAISDNGWGIPKNVVIANSIVTHCQQGIELGFSTHLNRVKLVNVTFIHNDVGLRIGDNYVWGKYRGHVLCIQCVFHHNTYVDILNLCRQTFHSIPHRLQLIDSVAPKGLPQGLKKVHLKKYLSLELHRDGATVPFVFDQIFHSIAAMHWKVAELCSSDETLHCTLDEYEQILTALMNVEQVESSKILHVPQLPQLEVHVFILWSNVPLGVATDVHALLSSGKTGLTVVGQYSVQPMNDQFDDSFFHQFYLTNPYTIWERSTENNTLIHVNMSVHKGTDTFRLYVVQDSSPEYKFIPGKGLVSKKIYELKHQVRAWLPGRYQIHASQTTKEANEDYHFLFKQELSSMVQQLHEEQPVEQLQPPIHWQQKWWPPVPINPSASPVSSAVTPMYTPLQASINVLQPIDGQIVYSSTLKIEWNLELENEQMNQRWKRNKHGTVACIAIASNGNNNTFQEDNTILKSNCKEDPFPTFRDLAPGKYVLKIWLVDESNHAILLTAPSLVPFEMDKTLLQNIAIRTNGNVVIGAALQAEWPVVEMNDFKYFLNNNLSSMLIDTYGTELASIVKYPNYTNEWENVLRSAMHGHHLPILASLPFDIVWYVMNVTIHHLGQLRTMNENTWNHKMDGATKRCAKVQDNSFHIKMSHCGVRDSSSPSLLKMDGYPTHSASVLAMIPHVSSLSKIFVAVGKSYDKLTLWDGNHRALAYYGAMIENAKTDSMASNIPGCSTRVLKNTGEEPFLLYVGLAPSWERGFLCH